MASGAWVNLAMLIVSAVATFPLVVIGLSLPERKFDWRRLAALPRPLAFPLLLLPILMTFWAQMMVPPNVLPGLLFMGWMLVVLAIVDARTFLLPDCLTLPLIAGGIVHTVLIDMRGPADFAGGLSAALENALAAAVGYGFMAFIAYAFRTLRGREGLGLGDAKLFAAAGAWLGMSSLPSVLLLGATSALMMTPLLARGRLNRTLPLPFGPYLAIGMWVTGLYGPLTFG